MKLFSLLLGTVCTVILNLPYAWVACEYWTWFALPLGAPAVGFLQMLGVIFFLELLRPHPTLARWQMQDQLKELGSEGLHSTFTIVLDQAMFALYFLPMMWVVGYLVHGQL